MRQSVYFNPIFSKNFFKRERRKKGRMGKGRKGRKGRKGNKQNKNKSLTRARRDQIPKPRGIARGRGARYMPRREKRRKHEREETKEGRKGKLQEQSSKTRLAPGSARHPYPPRRTRNKNKILYIVDKIEPP